MRTDAERAMLVSIRSTALFWATYKQWKVGDKQIRQHYLKVGMKDIVLACALYRVETNKRRVKS